MWNQVYNPLGNEWLSTLVAAIPVVVLLVLIASGKVKAHLAAVIALVAAILANRLPLPGPILGNEDILFWFVSQRMFPPIVTALKVDPGS